METAISNSCYVQCPCWSNEGNRCSISDGGVYLPLPHHVLMFCQSSCYNQCSQYIKGRKLIISKESVERRRMRRYSKNIAINIIVPEGGNQSSTNNRYKAMTLDVNLYGMKIESNNNVPTDSVVNFEIDKNICSEFVKGTGLVKWCERQVDSDNFEFGVAFSDDTTIQTGIEKLLCI